MSYVITRIASKNPDIAGLTLYLSGPCWWTLDSGDARKFKNKREAKKWFTDWNRDPGDCKIEKVT